MHEPVEFPDQSMDAMILDADTDLGDEEDED